MILTEFLSPRCVPCKMKFMGGGASLSYYGGEFIGVTAEIADKLTDEFTFLWNENYRRYEQKKTKLNEEAHFLSFLYYRLGVHNDRANQYIRRMWTAMKCDTIQQGDFKLPIWHLPAEKKFGFDKMFAWFRKHKSCSESEYLKASDRIMKISSSKFSRVTSKGVQIIIDKIKAR